jgi:hypothetical protein
MKTTYPVTRGDGKVDYCPSCSTVLKMGVL